MKEKMNNLFSPFISAYRESYNTQHVLVRLNGEKVQTIIIHWTCSYDCIPYDFEIFKLAAYALDKICCATITHT